MADHAGDLAVAERPDHAERVAHRVQQAEAAQVAVIGAVPAGGAAVAAQVRGDNVEPGGGERRHHLAPGIGEFREAVQQQDAGPAGGFVAGFQQVDAQAVDVFKEAGADAGGEHGWVQWSDVGHACLSGQGRRCRMFRYRYGTTDEHG